MARTIYGKHYKPWRREGRNRHGGANHRTTWRGFWGYHREMALEKSFHYGNNLSYGYRAGIPDDFYRFGGVGAQEYKANHTICNRWTNLLAQYKAVPWEGNFNATELCKRRHGLMAVTP